MLPMPNQSRLERIVRMPAKTNTRHPMVVAKMAMRASEMLVPSQTEGFTRILVE